MASKLQTIQVYLEGQKAFLAIVCRSTSQFAHDLERINRVCVLGDPSKDLSLFDEHYVRTVENTEEYLHGISFILGNANVYITKSPDQRASGATMDPVDTQ